MRRATLFRSVARHLEPGTPVVEAAYMWTRHRWMVPYALVAAAVVFLLSDVAGFTELATRAALGIAAGAVAVTATTDYRVLAATDSGLVLFRSSRIRQYAVERLRSLPSSTEIQPVGGTVLATDWQIGEAGVHTVPRSSERAMQRISALD